MSLYEHSTTLDLEVELIWKKRWSIVKVLFILNRYLGEALFIYLASALNWASSDVRGERRGMGKYSIDLVDASHHAVPDRLHV